MGYSQAVFHGSTLVTAKVPSLIDALTGAPGVAFPRTQLRSGIDTGSVTEPLHQTGSSLGILPTSHVFIAAFNGDNIAHLHVLVKQKNFPYNSHLSPKNSTQLVTIIPETTFCVFGYIIFVFMLTM